MRPLLALLLVLAIFGSVGGYLHFAQQTAPNNSSRQRSEPAVAEGKFALEITPAFDAGGQSAFSLEETQAASVRVQFRGRDLLNLSEPVTSGTPLRVEDVAGILPGQNEFYLEAQPQNPGFAAHAVRVRVFRDGNPVADMTVWSEPGLPVKGTAVVEVPAAAPHEHSAT